MVQILKDENEDIKWGVAPPALYMSQEEAQATTTYEGLEEQKRG